MLGQQLHLLLFYLQYPRPVCLVCCILGCNFPSISSIPTYLHVLPPKLGQNLHVAAHITVQFSGPHQPFTWLLTSIWIDFAENSQAWKNGKSNQKTKKESQHPALIPRLKLVKIKRFWRNSTQQNSKAGTQDQDPTKQIAFVQCTPSQSFHVCGSCFVPSSYLHGLDTHTKSKKCICCFSIFSTPHLFALFAASPGFKQSLQLLQLFYL